MYKSQLPAQEEILGAQGLGRPKQQQHPPEGVLDEKTCDPQEADHALIGTGRGSRSYRETDRDGLFAEHRTPSVVTAPSNPLRRHLEARFAAAGAPAPRVAVESGSILFSTALVERGGTLGYLPETLCRTLLDAGTLRDPVHRWRGAAISS